MYERLLAPDALSDSLERAIYLDGDLLLLDAIDILWNTDLRGGIIAAVQDAVIPRVSSPMGLRRFRELGCRPEEPYFNAGVLVVDLKAWRSQEVGQRAIEYLGRYSRSIAGLSGAVGRFLHGGAVGSTGRRQKRRHRRPRGARANDEP